MKMNKLYRIFRYDWPLHFTLLFTNWLPDNVVFLRLRGWLAHFFFKKCGTDLRLGRSIVFYNASKITIGDHAYIANGNWFSAGDEIVLGSEVVLGPKCVFASSNHSKKNGSFRYGESKTKPIFIHSGSWIGANCTITAGVTIGSGSLIGANTVVTKDVPDKVLFAGNPGKIIKEI